MSAKSKIELLLSIKNKMGNPLKKVRQKLGSSVKDMKENLKGLKVTHLNAFRAMRDEIPIFDRAMRLLGNPYVLITAGVISLTALLGGATNAAAQFNKEFLQVKNLNLDKNEQEMADYKKMIRSTAYDIGTNLGETTKAFYDIQSATGLYGNDVKEVFKQVGKFSIATGAQLNDSVNATTKAMKAFGLQASDIQTLLESNAKTVQVGIVTFEELAKVQTEYAGAAAAVGANVDTANKIFSAFTSIAKDANTAATMTKTAFEGLTQTNTIKGLKSIGVEMYDANGQMRDLSVVLSEVAAKFQDMSPKAIDETINKIGGPEGLRNLFMKLKTDAGDFFATLEGFDSSSFNLDSALENAKKDFSTLMQITKNRANNLMATLGERVLPHLVSGLEFLNNTILDNEENLNKLINTVKTLVKGFIIYKTTVFTLRKGMYLLKMGTMAYNFVAKLLTKGLKMATTSMKAFSGAMKANMIGLAVTAAVLLIDKLRSMAKETQGVKLELRSMNQVTRDYKKNVAELAGSANSLFEQLKRAGKGTAERATLIKKINDQYGGYLDNLLTEKSSLKEIELAQKRVNDQLIKKAKLQAYQDEMTKAFQAQAEARMKLEDQARQKYSHLTDDQYRGYKKMVMTRFDALTDEEKEALNMKMQNKNSEYWQKQAKNINLATLTLSTAQKLFGKETTAQDLKNKKLRDELFSASDEALMEALKIYNVDKATRGQVKRLAEMFNQDDGFSDFKTNTTPTNAPFTPGANGDGGGGSGDGLTPATGNESVNRVTGSAKQIQNLNVTIEALNKDGINIYPREIKEEDTKDLEDFFEELLIRAIRSVETSYTS